MTPPTRRLLVLDTSYTLQAIRANKLEASVTCRDLGGFFDEVWTVHPFASLLTTPDWSPTSGPPVETRLAPRHLFVEGKVGRFKALSGMAPLNFFIAQAAMLGYLLSLVKRRQISVVRAGDPLLMGLYGWFVARAAGIPLLVRVNGNNERIRQQAGRPIYPRFFRSAAVERAIEQFVLSRSDLVAAVNEDNRQFAIRSGASPERCTIFPYGNLVAPVHFLEPASRPDGRPLLRELGLGERPFLLCVGRLESIKMPDHAVRALAEVRRAGMDADLLMVGGGSQREGLSLLAQELGIAAHVVFAGERDQEWLSRVIPLAGVVLSPLTGRALSEVALAGAPTVAYDLDWQRELVRDGETGRLTPARDVANFANAALQLLRDRALARRLGSALRTLALDRLDPQRLDVHERQQYSRLLATSG